MKKLNLAIIGQGRSGRKIHGEYCLSGRNEYYTVKYVVEADKHRRDMAEKTYPGCVALCDCRELFDLDDVDLVVNASYSYMHYETTKALLEHKFNVLSEKPFAANKRQCEELIAAAKENCALLAVFQNSQYAPFYLETKRLIDDGIFGEIKQVSIRYNGFSRRWDWQTLQKMLGGSAYNTGPHPICMALGFLDFDKNTELIYSRLDSTPLSSGDADDYVKLLLSAPGKCLVDVEINSTDAYCDYNVKVQGTKGTLKCTTDRYKYKYIVDGENQDREVVETFLHNGDYEPIYCGEKLIAHEQEGRYSGDAFDVGAAAIYREIYYAITEGRPMSVTPEMTAAVYDIIDKAHKNSPLPVRFR